MCYTPEHKRNKKWKKKKKKSESGVLMEHPVKLIQNTITYIDDSENTGRTPPLNKDLKYLLSLNKLHKYVIISSVTTF